MPTKKKLVKNSLLNSVSSITLRISQIIQGLFVASILGPTMYGLKNAIQLISNYGSYSHLGLLNTFSKERQKYEYSDVKKRDFYTNYVFSFILLIGLLSIIIGFLCFLFLDFSFTVKVSILIIGFLIPVNLLLGFFGITLVSKSDFKSISLINLVQAIVVLISVVTLVYFFGIIGYFLGSLIGFFVILVLRWIKAKYKPKIKFDFSVFFNLIKKSLVLFFISLSYLLFMSIDRIFMIAGFGATELGYYAIGLFFANLMYFFVSTLVSPVVPQIYQNVKDKTELIKYIIKPIKITKNIIYFIVFLGLFLYPFVGFILPKYVPSFKYIIILLFSIIFFPVLIFNFFIASNKEKFLLWLTSIFVALAGVLDAIVVIFKMQPIYIAVATTITFFFYGTLTNLIGFKELLGSWRKAIKEVFGYLWALGYALIGYGLLWLLAHFWLYSFINYFVVKVIQTVLFSLWYLPVLIKLEKENKILKIIWDYLKGKTKRKSTGLKL